LKPAFDFTPSIQHTFRDSTNPHREITAALFPKHPVRAKTVFSLRFRSIGRPILSLSFGTVVAISGNYEKPIAIRLYPESAYLLVNFNYRERAGASRRFSQGQPVCRYRQNQTSRNFTFTERTDGGHRWFGIRSADF
jgi:hypothetical protein